MKESFVKAYYSKKKAMGITSPFYHSYLEICYNGKITKIGYYAKNNILWLISFLVPVLGEFRKEKKDYLFTKRITISKDKDKIKKLLKIIKSPKFKWRIYSAPFRNCFHWRNSVLRKASIKCPINDWF